MKKKILFGILVVILMSGCHDKKRMEMKKSFNSSQANAEQLIGNLKFSLKKVSVFAESLYNDPNKSPGDPSLYAMFNKVFYKKVNNGKSAVFVTGFVPVNAEIKKTVYFTEPLETKFIDFIKRHPQAVQIYYNDKNSYNRIYPWFDVLSQYSQNTDITQFSFYYLADSRFNPDRQVVVVDQPYLDPAGRGWIFSVISPVYYQDKLEGVMGIDINACDLFNSIPELKNYSYLLVQDNGVVIASSKDLETTFDLPDKSVIKYLNYLNNEEVLSNQYNLRFNKNIEIRDLFDQIEKGHDLNQITIENKTYQVVYGSLKSLNWILILLEKES